MVHSERDISVSSKAIEGGKKKERVGCLAGTANRCIRVCWEKDLRHPPMLFFERLIKYIKSYF